MHRQNSRPYGYPQQEPNPAYYPGGGQDNFGVEGGIQIPRAGVQQNPQQGVPALQSQPAFVGNYQASLPHRNRNKSKSKCSLGFTAVLDIIKVFTAEFLGTFILLFIGCSGFIFMPITFGVAIAVATQIFGHISGAHINPAVTIAAIIMGKINNYVLIPFYIIGQIAGAFVGFSLHYVITEENVLIADGFCVVQNLGGFAGTAYGLDFGLFNQGNLFAFEFLMSIFYIMAICSLWDRDNDKGASIPIKRGVFYTGIVLCMYLIISMPLSLNSLRAVVPLIFSANGSYYWQNHWDSHWIYWVGPNLGAVFGAGIYRVLKLVHDKSIKDDQYN